MSTNMSSVNLKKYLFYVYNIFYLNCIGYCKNLKNSDQIHFKVTGNVE